MIRNPIFRALLRLYPASFRHEYESELASDFAARARSTHPLLLWPELIADTLWNAAAAHFDILRQDLRWAVRSLIKTPGFTATAIAVSALGIGATAGIFTLADHVLIRPLPYRDPDRLVKVWQSHASSPGRLEASPANYRDWLAMNPPFETLAAWRGLQVNVSGHGEPRLVDGAAMTVDMLPMLGVQPVLGRAFTQEDDYPNRGLTVLLSDAEWRDAYGADPAIVGRRIVVDGSPAEIIGVMPPWFRFPHQRARIWTPIRFTPPDFEDRTNTFLLVVGRLANGVSLEQASERMSAIAARLAEQHPKDNAKLGTLVYLLKNEIPQQSRMLLYALAGAALGLLLIACTNLANLLLARAISRRRELAIRTSLGAGRERLTRQLLTESLLLSFAGGAAGVALGLAVLPLLTKLVPTMLPLTSTPTPDLRVWLICGGLTLLTGLGFGLIPAIIASRTPASALRAGRSGSMGAHRERARAALVIAEISLCVVLLTGSGLLLRALWNVRQADLGFKTENRLTLRTALPTPKYEAVARRDSFYTNVLQQTARLPGVHAAAYTSFLPIAMRGGIWEATPAGRPRDPDSPRPVSLRFITPDYFRAMGIPVIEGRGPAGQDTQDSQKVAIVSQSFVDRYVQKGVPAIGTTFDVAFFARTIIGIVGNVRTRGRESGAEPQVYIPHRQIPDGWMTAYTPKDLVIHTDDPSTTLAGVRRIVASADPEQPVSHVQTMEQLVDSDTEGRATQLYVLGAFAGAAFLLAAVGIHGLLAFGVSERRQEMGVRLALGAGPGDILGLVMKEGAVLGAAGLTLGIAGGLLTGRALQSLLAGVSPFDPVVLQSAAALCAAMALAASLGPAVRAVRVDPVESLRAE